MNYVIGSGPAGVACASALAKRGLEVTVVDIGDDLPPAARRLGERLRSTPLEARDPSLRAPLHAPLSLTTRGIGRKLVHGSDFAYGDGVRDTRLESHGVDVATSVARGGFSNVWGAAVLPVCARDIASWPLTLAELAPHYEAVLDMMPLAATKDDLTSLLPLYCLDRQPLRPSAQASALLEDLERSREALNARGFVFGAARLAVAQRTAFAADGCVYCGLCLHGCPYDLIYNSARTLDGLVATRRVRYVPGVIVRTVRERGDGVEISGQTRADGRAVRFDGARVFVAAGAMATTAIVLASLGAYDREITLRQSQYFAFPWLRYRGTRGVSAERVHTLAQVFLEVADPALSEELIHLQVYSYNDLFELAAERRVPRLLHPVLGGVLSHLLYVQGYLHSDVSPSIALRLMAGADGGRLRLDARDDGRATEIIRGLLAKLRAARRELRAVPIARLLTIGRPGFGAHVGGTFPMRSEPGAFDSDRLGRPAGFARVHVVDAAALPSLPATTITLTVMANAHRIGSSA